MTAGLAFTARSPPSRYQLRQTAMAWIDASFTPIFLIMTIISPGSFAEASQFLDDFGCRDYPGDCRQ